MFLLASTKAQDTFSIVAVDPETGEVGSAGATCLDSLLEGTSAIIISDVLPGKGAIHTQSFWNPTNQANARIRMEVGDSPDEIMTWLEANDADGTPELRQYGAVDFDPVSGTPRVASFTGTDCFFWYGDFQGPSYAVQGNILIGPEVLDSMSWQFFFTEGDLADKLMAAMQGAKIPGADERCLAEGVSSRSAFIRVAKPDDSTSFYLDLVVGVTPFGVDPIDALQNKFDTWRAANPPAPPEPSGFFSPQLASLEVYPNPVTTESRIVLNDFDQGSLILELYSATGQRIASQKWNGQGTSLAYLLPREVSDGLYLLSAVRADSSTTVARTMIALRR